MLASPRLGRGEEGREWSTMVKYDTISRVHILDAWVAFYQGKPVDFIIGHSSELGDKLEKQLRGLGQRKGYTTKTGMKKRALMGLVGRALGVHRQIRALARSGKLPRSLTDTGILKGRREGKDFINQSSEGATSFNKPHEGVREFQL
ncbi:hypothetical protein ES703_108802 [subsurface metagenome]